MVYNKRSTQWLSRACLYVGLLALVTILAVQWNQSVPEIEVLNSLETVNKIHLGVKNILTVLFE